MITTIALFGESEKGRFCYPYICNNLYELSDILGNPPEDSLGISFAIQALMYERQVIFLEFNKKALV